MPVINGVLVAIPPPEGYVVNFERPQRRHEIEAYVASSVGMGIAFLFVLQYLYVKVWILRKLEFETGVHTWEIPLAKFNTGNQLSFVVPILYAVCTAFSKMALALFYRKLSPQRWWRWSVYGVLFLVAGYNLAIMLVILFGCVPFEKSWDHTMLEGTCVNRPAVYICTAGLGIFSDLILLVMPLPMVLRSQIPRRQKAGLIVLFAIGSATLVTSVIRLVLLVPIFGAVDVSWIISGAIVWVAQPVRTVVTVYTPDEERDETIKQLRRQQSIKKFGSAAVETQTWDACKDGSDDEELGIVQTTTVTVVYGPRESYMPPKKVEDMA
ncbi:integral membrane protein [Fusarium langsethiae]|uniref:Integral membrane protein n=1 Tax=Fusarium langsethiae TaxID=179993 RepID=A0A0M9F2G3_FUSLA|nr:integral membrane protein [Fusarium langsethiae]GKU00284.1 unnamed protein product [Fusarium langsethiae]GKU13857.1 unnamed protein product [Fusarium langsethiae]